jgi:transposase
MGKHRKYTEEFRREAVRVVESRGNRTVRDVAESLGIAESLLHGWRAKYADTVASVWEERGETPEEELRRLRAEVAQLKRDREILKKAAAFFAKEG